MKVTVSRQFTRNENVLKKRDKYLDKLCSLLCESRFNIILDCHGKFNIMFSNCFKYGKETEMVKYLS